MLSKGKGEKREPAGDSAKEREREEEWNVFALFALICLCGSALTSTWAGGEAKYAKQCEERQVTPEQLRKRNFCGGFLTARRRFLLFLLESNTRREIFHSQRTTWRLDSKLLSNRPIYDVASSGKRGLKNTAKRRPC